MKAGGVQLKMVTMDSVPKPAVAGFSLE